MIVMKHEHHGIHFAQSMDEATALEKRGWKLAPEEQYRLDPSLPRPDQKPAQDGTLRLARK